MTGIAYSKRVKSRLFSPLLCFLLAFSLCSLTHHPSKENLNYAVHARFVYHFVKYLNWPAASKSNNRLPIVLGVMGNKNMYSELAQACAGKKIEDRPLEVRTITTIQEATQCQLVFLGDKENDQLNALVKAIQNDPTVLVCESPGSITAGADINFVVKEERLRFELNTSRLQKKSIQVASELKRLAIIPIER